jgi:hypothetical protein
MFGHVQEGSFMQDFAHQAMKASHSPVVGDQSSVVRKK